MNRRVRLIGRVMAGSVLLGGVAVWAAWDSGGPSATQAVLSGKIASVDAQRNLLKIKTGFLTQEDFLVKGSTRISDGSKGLRLQDLKPGDEVTVSYSDADGKHVASSLMVSAPSPQAGKAEQGRPDQSPARAESTSKPASEVPAKP